MGYNIKLSYDELGSGTVAGYYAVTGCKDFDNVEDRGCMKGVPGPGIMKLHNIVNDLHALAPNNTNEQTLGNPQETKSNKNISPFREEN